MADLHKSVATLRIAGDELVPEEVTRRLGHAPTTAKRKGDRSRRKDGTERVARTGMWHLEASNRSPGNLDAQVREILDQLTSDLEAWRFITSRFRVDLFCGVSLNESNEGFVISAAMLLALGSRGIELGLDIYQSGQDEAPN